MKRTNKYLLASIIVETLIVAAFFSFLNAPFIKKSMPAADNLSESDNATVLGQSNNLAEMSTTNAIPTLTSTPQIQWDSLKTEIDNIVGKETSKWGVYVQDMQTGSELKINADKSFEPASIYKVSLALIILRDIDSGKLSFDNKYKITDAEKISGNYLGSKSGEYMISLKDLLYYMIVQSDNTAMTTIEHRLGGVSVLQKRMKTELGSGDFTRLPMSGIAQDIGHVFAGLYNGAYLKSETNNYLLDLMKHTAATQDYCLKKAIPNEATTAHKAGYFIDVRSDAGIVWGKDANFVIVILNHEASLYTADKKCRNIASAVYKFLNP